MKLVEPKPLALSDVAESVTRINNVSRTLKWGMHLEDNMLVLVAGHPSVKNSHILYLIFRITDEGLSMRCEVDNKDFHADKIIIDRKELSSIVISILKDVYGGQ